MLFVVLLKRPVLYSRGQALEIQRGIVGEPPPETKLPPDLLVSPMDADPHIYIFTHLLTYYTILLIEVIIGGIR